jgi:IS5 family transposase
MKRRTAIEPVIGHMKNDGHLGRNYLKGKVGDMTNARFQLLDTILDCY